MKQIDMMRFLHKQFQGNEDLVVQAYARAEDKGEVKRKSNTYGMSSEEYARRLFYTHVQTEALASPPSQTLPPSRVKGFSL